MAVYSSLKIHSHKHARALCTKYDKDESYVRKEPFWFACMGGWLSRMELVAAALSFYGSFEPNDCHPLLLYVHDLILRKVKPHGSSAPRWSSWAWNSSRAIRCEMVIAVTPASKAD